MISQHSDETKASRQKMQPTRTMTAFVEQLLDAMPQESKGLVTRAGRILRQLINIDVRNDYGVSCIEYARQYLIRHGYKRGVRIPDDLADLFKRELVGPGKPIDLEGLGPKTVRAIELGLIKLGKF